MKALYERKWSYGDYLKFIFPSVMILVFSGLYTSADNFFVSVGVGPIAMAAINIIFPIISIAMGLSIMISIGGSAIISMKLGEGKKKEADEKFTLTIIITIVVGIIYSAIILLFLDKIIYALGSTETLYPYCKDYIQPLLFAMPVYMLKFCMEMLVRNDGRTDLAMYSTILGGIINIVLDYIFIMILGMGIFGAALGTILGIVGTLFITLGHFFGKKSVLKFTKVKMDWRFLRDACVNGSSEMVTELSGSIVTILFNLVLISRIGEEGIAAISIVLALNFLFISALLGISMGIQPVLSFCHGSGNKKKINQLIRQSAIVIAITSLIIYTVGTLFGDTLIGLFAKGDEVVYRLGTEALNYFSISFLFVGFNIFASGFFTALNNGKVSALLSLMRTLIFVVPGIFILPMFFGNIGIWLTIPVAEILSLFFSWYFVRRYRRKILLKPLEEGV